MFGGRDRKRDGKRREKRRVFAWRIEPIATGNTSEITWRIEPIATDDRDRGGSARSRGGSRAKSPGETRAKSRGGSTRSRRETRAKKRGGTWSVGRSCGGTWSIATVEDRLDRDGRSRRTITTDDHDGRSRQWRITVGRAGRSRPWRNTSRKHVEDRLDRVEEHGHGHAAKTTWY